MKKDYNEKTDELLIELAKQDEMKNRKLFGITVLATLASVISYLSIIIISTLAFGEGTLFGIIATVSTIIFLGAMFLIFKYEVDAGYHSCNHCNHKFVPTYIQAILVPHIGYTRYLKCPKCGKRSWAKKVMSK